MFKVTIRKKLQGAKWHYLEKQIHLPFHPYVGLVLCSGPWEARLVKVAYLVDECRFSCEVDSYVEPKVPSQTMEDVLKINLEKGWEEVP